MIDRVKAVNNPLTIIAIFAALAEIAGTVALKFVAADLQVTFIWFVMLFPTLLVLLFFLTLNFNPKVLYAPSDFRNEENFLNVISGVGRLSINLDEVQQQLEQAKTQIIDDAVKQIGIASENERARLVHIVNSRINPVQERVESTRESAEDVAQESFITDIPKGTRLWKLFEILSEGRSISGQELVDRVGFPSSEALYVHIARLRRKGLNIATVREDGALRYRLESPIQKDKID